jgi:hypothetical protein
VAEVLADQLFEAERLHVEHLAAGEMHIAHGRRLRAARAAHPCAPARAAPN